MAQRGSPIGHCDMAMDMMRHAPLSAVTRKCCGNDLNRNPVTTIQQHRNKNSNPLFPVVTSFRRSEDPRSLLLRELVGDQALQALREDTEQVSRDFRLTSNDRVSLSGIATMRLPLISRQLLWLVSAPQRGLVLAPTRSTLNISAH